jgi:hypothetical protein
MVDEIDKLEGKTMFPQKFTLPGVPEKPTEAELGGEGLIAGPVEDVSDLLYGQGLGPEGEPMPGMSPMDVIQRMEDLAARAEPVTPPGTRPEGTEQVIDSSWEGRERFKSQIIQEHMPWGDPTQINPREKLEEYMEQELPQVFENFFAQHPSGAILWEDRDKLDSDEKKQWLAKLRGVKAHVLGLWEERKKSGTAFLGDAMNFHANKVKAHETKVAKELEAMRKARGGGGKPLVKEMQNEKGEFTWHYWDPEAKKFVDTGNLADKEERYSDEVQWAIDFIHRSMNTKFPDQPQVGLSFQARPGAMIKSNEFKDLLDALRPPPEAPKPTQNLYKRAIEILEKRFKAGEYAEKAAPSEGATKTGKKKQGLELPTKMGKVGEPLPKPKDKKALVDNKTGSRYWIGDDDVWHPIPK